MIIDLCHFNIDNILQFILQSCKLTIVICIFFFQWICGFYNSLLWVKVRGLFFFLMVGLALLSRLCARYFS